MTSHSLAVVSFIALALSGCVAKTAASAVGTAGKVATAPVRATKGAVTTNQSKADERRGRELRKTQEKLRDLEKDRARQQKRCDAGDARACDRVAAIDRQMADLRVRFQL